MASGDLLLVEPLELEFPFELNKQISCSMQLSNKTDDFVAFKVKTTSPKKYSVRPNAGIIFPRSTCDVVVTMQAQREAPPGMQCKDKFLVQGVATSSTTSLTDINAEMFSKEPGKTVDEIKLQVIYVSPPQPPSTVSEEFDQSTSSGPFSSTIASEYAIAPKQERKEYEEKHEEAMISAPRITEKKNPSLQQNSNLPEDAGPNRRQVSRQRGFFLMLAALLALLAIFLGYLVKR